MELKKHTEKFSEYEATVFTLHLADNELNENETDANEEIRETIEYKKAHFLKIKNVTTQKESFEPIKKMNYHGISSSLIRETKSMHQRILDSADLAGIFLNKHNINYSARQTNFFLGVFNCINLFSITEKTHGNGGIIDICLAFREVDGDIDVSGGVQYYNQEKDQIRLKVSKYGYDYFERHEEDIIEFFKENEVNLNIIKKGFN